MALLAMALEVLHNDSKVLSQVAAQTRELSPAFQAVPQSALEAVAGHKVQMVQVVTS
jgi:hypothetical protein